MQNQQRARITPERMPAELPAATSILKPRAILRDLLESVGIDPRAALDKFDRMASAEAREEALEKTRAYVDSLRAKKQQQTPASAPPAAPVKAATPTEQRILSIRAVLDSKDWGLTEAGSQEWLEKTAEKPGFELETATEDQLAAIIAEIVTLGYMPEI